LLGFSPFSKDHEDYQPPSRLSGRTRKTFLSDMKILAPTLGTLSGLEAVKEAFEAVLSARRLVAVSLQPTKRLCVFLCLSARSLTLFYGRLAIRLES